MLQNSRSSKTSKSTFSDKIKSVTVSGNNVIVTYNDNSTDTLEGSRVYKSTRFKTNTTNSNGTKVMEQLQ